MILRSRPMDKPDKPDEPKKPPKSSRADQIQRELKKSTDFTHQHIDEKLVDRKLELRKIIQRGSLEDFVEALQRSDVNPDSPEGQRFIAVFREIHGLD